MPGTVSDENHELTTPCNYDLTVIIPRKTTR